MARRATKIAEERKSDGAVLVLDAGNSLTGDRDPAKSSAGATSVEAMNLLGYDAMTVGATDLALGRAVLRQRMAEARFPFLSANAIDKETGALFAKPFVVVDVEGYRVAIIGVTGHSEAEWVTASDPVAAVRNAVETAKEQADAIIVLSSADTEADHLIADTVPGLAAVVGGGAGASQKPWVSSRTKVPVLHADEASAGHAGRILGIGRLELHQDGSLADYAWQQFPLGPDIADDAAIATWVRLKQGG